MIGFFPPVPRRVFHGNRQGVRALRAMAVKLINPGQPLVVRKAKPVSVQLRAETTKPAEVVGHPEGDPRGMRQVRTLQRAEGYDLRRRTVGYQLKMTKTGEPRGRPVPPPFGP